jgi:pimeloyl-ACP methyl ester carboxylesterase
LAGGFELLGPLAQQLAPDFEVITFQLRGEDDCFDLRRRFGLNDLVEDLDEFLSWFGLECPPILGVSFGGVLALELALRRPHRLACLMVQGVGARFERGLLQQVAGAVLSRYPLPDDSPFINQFFNLLFGGRQKPGPLVDFVTRQCWQTDQGVMAHRFHLVEPYDVGNRGAGVRLEALAMAGDRDLLVSPQSLTDLGRALPRAHTEVLAGCGHLAFVTHPDRVAEKVKDFLRDQ